MEIKRTCSIVLEPTPEGLARMRYRIRWNGSRSIVAVNIPYLVDPTRWEASAQSCRKNTWHGRDGKIPARRVNAEIARYETAVDETFASFEVEETAPTKEEFRERLQVRLGRKEPEPATSVRDLMGQFIDEESRMNAWTARTEAKFTTMLRLLTEWKEDVGMADLNADGLAAMVRKWEDEYKYRPITVDKYLRVLKRFLKWATAKGYTSDSSWMAFKPKLKILDQTVIFLDWDELMTVYGWEFGAASKSLETVRDVFCFCCFTGLRYSDVYNLRKSDIGSKGVTITTIKTHDKLLIEWNRYSQAIIDKYRDVPMVDDRALPVISNQKMNVRLKELMQLCGIDSDVHLTYYIGRKRHDEVRPKYELITTHSGRKTFVCNALMKGIPAEIVMKWTGHSNYEAMKPYIAVADAAKAEAMKRFDE